MCKKLLLFIALLGQSIFAFSQWQLTNTGINTFYDLHAVNFPNANRGYAGGPYAFYKTTNGGTNWTDALSPIPNAYRGVSGIHFLNSDTGFICGWTGLNSNNAPIGGFVLKTTNGGTSWTNALINAPGPIFSVKFINGSEGYAAGGSSDGAANVYHSTNGGDSWTLESDLDGMNLDIMDMDVTPSGDVFLAGMWKKTTFDFREIVFRKLSGSSSYDSTTFSGPMFCTMYNKVRFIDDNTGYMVGNKCFNKTTDGGQTWTPTELNNATSSASFNAMDFATASNGWAGGNNGDFYHTIDGGANWSAVTGVTGGANINDIHFVNPTLGYLVADGGAVYKYTAPSSVGEMPTGNAISFFPNPATGSLQFGRLEGGKRYIISIADLSGRTVTERAISERNNLVDLKALVNGVYIITVTADNQVVILKDRLLIAQ